MDTHDNNVKPIEKSDSIKRDIEDCYRAAIKYLELYTNSSLRHAGNQKLFYINFVSKFQSLFYFTRVDNSLKRDDNKKLLDDVDRWFNDGVLSNQKKGIELFLKYSQALFDKGILSFRR